MNPEQIIEKLGGPSEVARLCECSPQAVSQWFGIDPATGLQRDIPNARLLYLKAVRPDVFEEPAKKQDEIPVDVSRIMKDAKASPTNNPVLKAEMVNLEKEGILRLTKQPTPRTGEERRKVVRRADDRAMLAAFEAAGQGQGA